MSKSSARRRPTRQTADPATAEPASSQGEAFSTEVLESALRRARSAGRRQLGRQRLVFVTAAVGVVCVAARGLLAVAFPARAGAPALAGCLGLVVSACVLMTVSALRSRRRLERLAREVQTMNQALAALGPTPRPLVEILPQETPEGSEIPVVVVRTDSTERLFHEDTHRGEAPSSPLVAVAIAALMLLGVGSTVFVGADSTAPLRWTFIETQEPSAMGFSAIGREGGTWSVEGDAAATGARALVNRAGSESAPPATLIASSLQARDLRIRTRCKVAASGRHTACGVVFRHVDGSTYHVARVDVHRQRLVVAVVEQGRERVLGEVHADVAPGVWQELTVEARAETLRATCNDREVVEVRGAEPGPSGPGGLWVPAATEASFDDLVIEDIGKSASSSEVVPSLLRKRS